MKKIVLSAILAAFAVQAKSQEKNPEIFFSLAGESLRDKLSPVNSVYFDRHDIESEKSGGMAGVLDSIPSVQVRRSGGGIAMAFPSIRGFYSKQTSVIVDGVKVPKDLTGTVDFSLLPLDNISSAEVLKGGWSALYGSNTEGGAVLLETRRLNAGAQIAEASATYGSFGSKLYELKSGFGKDRFQIFTGASSYYTDGFQENSSAVKNSFNGRLSYDTGDYGSISASGFAVKAKRGLPGGTPADISVWNGENEKKANTPWDNQRDDNYNLNLSYNLEKEGKAFSADYGRSVYLVNAHQYNSWTSSFDDTAIKTISNQFSLRSGFNGYEFGFQAEFNDLRSDTYGSHNIESYGYFANKTYNAGDKLSFMPMLRFDDNRQYPSVWSPKILTVYSATEGLKFSFQAGRAWQAPTFADLYNPWAPNPSLRAEKSVQTEFSAQYGSPSGFYSSVGIYYYDIKDRIALDPSRSWAAYNIDRAFTSGTEAEAGFAAGTFNVKAGLNIMDSRGKTAGQGSYKKLAYLPDYKFNSSVKYKTGLGEITFKMEAVSTQYSGRDHTGKKIPAYRVYGISFSKKAGVLELYAAVDNLFDERYAVNADSYNGYYPADPRTFSGGVKLKF